MTFKLKELRKKKKISQQRLAIDLNMNQNMISDMRIWSVKQTMKRW